MAMTPNPPQRPSFAPRNWPGWMAVGLIWLLGQIPQRGGIALSRPLGWLLMKLLKRRVKIVERNIERCFPGWSREQRDDVVRGHFRSLARMVFEQAWSWSASEKRVDSWGEAIDPEYANRLTREGRGVLKSARRHGVPVYVPALTDSEIGLDIALGIGGLPRGRVVEVYGPESSGKTTVALHRIAYLAYDDAEVDSDRTIFVVFSPALRNYVSHVLPALIRKFHLAALASVNDLDLEQISTKSFVQVLDRFELKKALIVVEGANTNLELSARNLPFVKVLRAEGVNVYDILKYPNLVMTEAAIDQIEGVLAK